MFRITSVLGFLFLMGWGVVTTYAQDNPATPAAGMTTISVSDPLAGTREEQEFAYRPLGNLAALKVYFRDNEKVGERVFYPNGNIAEERLFANGKLHGIMRQFYMAGKLFSEYPYREGKLHGGVHFYKENGELLGESTFENGTGILRQFPLESLLLRDKDIPYKDGVVHGIVREWAPWTGGQGVGCNVTEYVDGNREGWSVIVNEDGSLLSSAYRHNGQLHGVYRRFVAAGEYEEGFPKFLINNKKVTEAVYREAAKTDEVLSKSLDDDHREWGKKMAAMPRQPLASEAVSVNKDSSADKEDKEGTEH